METLIGCAFIMALLVGAISAVFIGRGSGKKEPNPQKNFLEQAAGSALSDVYRLKKVQRNGKNMTFLITLGEKGAANSDKNHPTKTPKVISGPK
jgi:hypothetical protein